MISTWTDLAAAIGGSAELSILAKATVALGAGLLAVRVARRARASVRHLLLACTMGGTLILPVLATLAPIAPIDIPILAAINTPADTARADAINAGVSAAEGDARGNALRSAQPSNGDGAAANSETRSGLSWLSSAFFSLFGLSLSATPWVAITHWMRTIWALGTVLLLASLATALWRLMRLRQSAVPWLDAQPLVRGLASDAGVRQRVDILLHEEVAAPFTCGMRQPAIVLPADARTWREADVRRALIHELEHVRRGDWGLHLMARITCAAYWCHPLAWIASRKLSLEAERACDDAVVRQAGMVGADGSAEDTEYAEQLVSLAQRLRRASGWPVLAMANRSDLSARVTALLDATQPRGRAGLPTTMTTIAAAVAVVLAMAPVRAVRASSPDAVDAVTVDAVTVDTAAGDAADATGAAEPQKPRNETRRGPSSVFAESMIKAADEGNTEGLTQLINAGADPNVTLGGDGSPLIVAAREGHLKTVQLLLDRGADPNLGVDGDGTPLIMAAREGHLPIVQLLLSRGAHIDQIQKGDENPLIQASANGQLSIVKYLIEKGADVNASAWEEASGNRPGEWRTPMSQARKGKHTQVMAALEAAGAR